MTTEDVLLNDVLDNPDDVEPRLYYADYQLEYGNQALGEFIHTQIEIGKYDPKHCLYCVNVNTERYKKSEDKLIARSAELLRPAWGQWLWDNASTGTDHHTHWYSSFRNGFLDAITITHKEITTGKKMERVFRNHPVTSVIVTGRMPAQYLTDTGTGFSYWVDAGKESSRLLAPNTIHRTLFDLLDGYADLTTTGLPECGTRKIYDNNELAIQSLFQAALALGRSYRRETEEVAEGRNT